MSEAIADRVTEPERRDHGDVALCRFLVVLLKEGADVFLPARGIDVMNAGIERGSNQSLS